MSDDEFAWLIVGLGNPGPEYERTRHNIGHLAVAELARRMGLRLSRHRRAEADVATGRLAGQRVTLLRSRGYMNVSGGPVAAAANYERLAADRTIVIHDDLDLDFGRIRLKLGGGDSGHNGLKSIRKSLGTGDYYRVRVGIGRPPGRQDPADYVLSPFNAAQRAELPGVIEAAADAVEMLLTTGLANTQNQLHSR